MLRIHDIETARSFISRWYDATLSAAETRALTDYLRANSKNLPYDVRFEGEPILALEAIAADTSALTEPDGLQARLMSAIDKLPAPARIAGTVEKRPWRRRLFLITGAAAAVIVAALMLLPLFRPDQTGITSEPAIASVSSPTEIFNSPEPEKIDIRPMMKSTASYTKSVSKTVASTPMDSETGARIALSALKIISANLTFADHSITTTSENINHIHSKIKTIFKK